MAALGMAAATAHAQAPGKAAAPAALDAKSVAEAEKHFEAGNAAAERSQWKKAEDEYRKAYALSPLPQILGSLGEAALRLGRPRDAAEHLARFLAEDKGAGADERAAATALLVEAKKDIVTLKIAVTEPGSEVLVDEELIGVAPLPAEIYVTPGRHTVRARKGTARAEATGTYEKGWTRVIKLEPKEQEARAQPLPAPTVDPKAPPQSASLPVKSPSPFRTVALVSGGAVALAGIGVGVAGLALSAAKSSERDAVCTGGACLQPGVEGYHDQMTVRKGLDDERVLLFNMGVPALVVGGIAAAGTGVAFFLWKPAPAGVEARTGIRLVPSGPGVTLRADW